MPLETSRWETPGERVMRQHYQLRTAERAAQLAHLGAQRELMRRGSLKMQDGTLGRDTGKPETDEMNVRVGDEVHYHYEPETQPSAAVARQSASQSSIAARLATLAAIAGLPLLGAGGLAAYQSATAPEQQQSPAQQSPVEQGEREPEVMPTTDRDTYYEYGVRVRPPEK